jgi:Transcriptional regulatory protein, C terminal
MDPMSETPAIVEFGRFRILPHRRELLVDDQPIRIGGRAFDVLMALIEARGAVLSKDALMSRVWPNRNVEENAIQAQISALRDVFGGGPWPDPDGPWARLPVHRRCPGSFGGTSRTADHRPDLGGPWFGPPEDEFGRAGFQTSRAGL